jgi:hypothetical protein
VVPKKRENYHFTPLNALTNSSPFHFFLAIKFLYSAALSGPLFGLQLAGPIRWASILKSHILLDYGCSPMRIK